MPVVIRGPDQKIVACGTLMLERKFIHNCGILAHIEDIVVRSEERGMGLGKLLISQLSYLARHQGAYKITLDCDPENAPFYAKSSFEVKGLQMCVYFRDTPGSSKQE